MKKFILMACLCPILAIGQQTNQTHIKPEGIHFEKVKSLSELVLEAQKEQKYIFVDCYTTWCGPCRWMSENVFPLKAVGEYMNAHFISVKLQMDKTDKDPADVRALYNDAHAIAQGSEVNAFPTYLIFTPDFHIIHRFSGSLVNSKNPSKEFIDLAAAAFDPNKAYYSSYARYLIHKNDWKSNIRDNTYLYTLMDTAAKFGDSENLRAIAKTYINQIKSPWNKQNLNVILSNTNSVNDKYFKLVLEDSVRVAEVLQMNVAIVNRKLKSIVEQDEVMPQLYDSNYKTLTVDWKKLEHTLRTKYPAFGERIVCEQKVNYYKNAGDTLNWEKAIKNYMDRYGRLEISKSNLIVNNKAWDVFGFSKNQELLRLAIEWMQPVIAQYQDPGFDWADLDTYANLLYKVGDQKGAILWERRAIEKVGSRSEGQRKEMESCFAKMQKGEKTWK